MTASLLIAFFAGIVFSGLLAGAETTRRLRRERKARMLELRLAMNKLANGGWTARLDEDVDPEVAKSVRVVGAVLDNMELALRKQMEQNEELRETARLALVRLAREKERPEAADSRLKVETVAA